MSCLLGVLLFLVIGLQLSAALIEYLSYQAASGTACGQAFDADDVVMLRTKLANYTHQQHAIELEFAKAVLALRNSANQSVILTVARRLVQRVFRLSAAFNGGLSNAALAKLTFGRDDPGVTGGVGNNGARILATMQRGNERETMSLIYQALANGQASRLVSSVADKIKLTPALAPVEQWSQSHKLHLNLSLIKSVLEDVELNRELQKIDLINSRPCYRRMFVPMAGSSVRNCRCLCNSCNSGVTTVCRSKSGVKRNRLKVSDVDNPPMGEFEMQYILEQNNFTQRTVDDIVLSWLPGSWYFDVPIFDKHNILATNIVETSNAKCKPITRNIELRLATELGFHMYAGPSGTTDVFMWLARYMNFNRFELQVLRLALISWMIPAQDHTLHEIMQAANDHNVGPPYMCSANTAAAIIKGPGNCLFRYAMLTNVPGFEDETMTPTDSLDRSFERQLKQNYRTQEETSINDAIRIYNQLADIVGKVYDKFLRE